MASKKKQLLVIEDDRGLQKQLRWAFKDYEVHMASERNEGVALMRRLLPGVVLLDLGLPPYPGCVTEGLKALEEILSIAPETKVIVVTGDEDRGNAIEAVGLGAYDFYQKPVEPDTLGLLVERAYHVYQLECENKELQKVNKTQVLEGIAATSPQMLEVCRMAEKVAPVDVTVLLQGASGTGKERFAQAIHKLSGRADKEIVAINCAAIPENLLESELFGHEKGAFTGASAQKIGKIERADKGTLFLDEIGDLPMDLQAKMLRFLQERVIERVGGDKEINVNTRIICATHRDMEKMIEEGSFREDLYYRIKDVTLRIPSLKDREGDAVLLAQVFLERFSKEFSLSTKGFSKDAISAIEIYHWPGNVRELESKVKRAMIMSANGLITVEDLELNNAESELLPLNIKDARDEAERRVLLRALGETNYNISDTANLLGVARPTVYKLIDKFQVKI